MKFTDSHTHIYLEQFEEDIQEVIQRANDSNISRFLLPNIDLESIPKMNHLCDTFPKQCFPMIGLHPCDVKDDWQEVLDKMKILKSERDYIAIGEIGIDLYWDKTNLQAQQDAFAKQIEWAKEEKLPIVIHARDSFNEIFEVVDQYIDENLKGIFHCFTGGEKEAKKILDYNSFLFGIGGVVTFKNSGLDKTLEEFVPLNKIVLETDAPYLAPTPYRGKRNEPSYISNIVDKLVDIYKVAPATISETTEQNIEEMFSFTS